MGEDWVVAMGGPLLVSMRGPTHADAPSLSLFNFFPICILVVDCDLFTSYEWAEPHG